MSAADSALPETALAHGSCAPLPGYTPSDLKRPVESGSSPGAERSGRSLLVVAHGGGVNSNAMLEGMRRRGIVPDLILTADTGGERPEIYDGWKITSDWCEANGMPRVVIVREPGPTLEEDCLTRKALPSIAYGFKTCSQRWKMRPQDRYLKTWLPEGASYRKAIGYDAGEERRCRPSDDPRCENWYPLIEWGMWREECVEHCRDAGLPAVKSACFFCPSSKKGEVLRLAKEQPALMARAAAMEANAELTTVAGLGRHWNWTALAKMDAAQLKLFSDAGTPEIDCGCYDGDSLAGRAAAAEGVLTSDANGTPREGYNVVLDRTPKE